MNFEIENYPLQSGRIAIVTGANTGLGFETTRYFAQKGMKVILACRTESRALKAIEAIEHELPAADLEFMPLDLSSLTSVKAFAETYKSKHAHLDILVNNAGIMWVPYSVSEDGFESQMAANYFGHFLLTSLLIELMPDTPESRIVSLASLAHQSGMKRIRFEDIHWEKSYSKIDSYAHTKLACLMYALELQNRLDSAGKKILSTAAHPGISATELLRTLPKILTTLMPYTIGPLMTHEPDEAAKPSVVAALEPSAKGGDYYGPQGFREAKGKPGKAKIMRWARDREAQQRLWDLSVELTGAEYPF